MRDFNWQGTAIALAAGLGGALIAMAIGLPAAVLMGSAFAVTAAALLRLKPSIPVALREASFCVIGVSLGSGVTPDFWSEVARWPLSIALLAVTVIAVLLACGTLLKWVFRADMTTALLATSPGALSYTLGLADDRGADLRFVIVIQSLRLVIIIMLLPPLIGYSVGLGEATHVDLPHLGLAASVGLLAVSFGLGFALTRLRSPAPYLIAGLLVSGVAHGAGLVSGGLADPLTFFGFWIIGALTGTRFAGVTILELKRLGLAGLASASAAIAISLTGAFAVSSLLDLPFGQVWVSFAPGGVEGMSSMALALGYDPVYVATHHVFRILFLILVLPILIGLLPKRQ